MDKKNTGQAEHCRLLQSTVCFAFYNYFIDFFSVNDESKVTGYMQNPAELADDSYLAKRVSVTTICLLPTPGSLEPWPKRLMF